MKRISLFVGGKAYEALKKLAQQRERGVAELFRDALDRYLEEAELRAKRRTPRRKTRQRKGGKR